MRSVFEELLSTAPAERRGALDALALAPALHAAVQQLLAADDAEGGAPSAPRQLGHYELLSLLGRGGMGEVHLAHDRTLDRQVALKLLAPQLTEDPRWLARFRREARAASAVNHPSILTIHEIGAANGTHFIATEYIEGETLRDRIVRGPVEVSEALDIAQQIAGALDAAHAAGIVHRDIKPENVMLRRDGFVKVLDFGLAKLAPQSELEHRAGQARGDQHGSDVGLMTGITTPGMVMGTLAYLSPEQARGQEADARSDVFALAVVLYELLTGRVPFSGASPVDLLVAILQQAPAPLSPGLERSTPGLSAVLTRAFAKDRDLRTESAAAFQGQLRALRSGEHDHAEPVPGAGEHADPPPMVRYAQSGEVNIAYQVLGVGPPDLVFVMGWVSHLEYFWSEPSFARFLRRLASFSRVILFDKRGTGLSDRVPIHELPTLEQRMDDVRAVMDAVGSQRAVLCGVSEGGPMCSLFAATYPERTIALVMIGSYARRLRDVDYPWGPTDDEREQFLDEIRKHWGGPVGIESRAPSRATDPQFRAWWAAYLRHGASPTAAVALTRMNGEVDVRKVLSTVRVPTLVVHRSGDRCLVVEEGRYLAEHIPGARFVELSGIDHLPFVGQQSEILDTVQEFLGNVTHDDVAERVLATVLIVEPCFRDTTQPGAWSAEDEARLEALADGELTPFQGRVFARSSHGVRASFDGPARAIRAATRLVASAYDAGLRVRVGLHTGECDLRGDALAGIAVELAQRITERAHEGGVLASSTVRDLVAGAGFEFVPAGEADLGGGLGALRLYLIGGPAPGAPSVSARAAGRGRGSTST